MTGGGFQGWTFFRKLIQETFSYSTSCSELVCFPLSCSVQQLSLRGCSSDHGTWKRDCGIHLRHRGQRGFPGRRTRGLADRNASSSFTVTCTAAEGGKEHGFCHSGQVPGLQPLNLSYFDTEKSSFAALLLFMVSILNRYLHPTPSPC